jgi:membrane-associated protein
MMTLLHTLTHYILHLDTFLFFCVAHYGALTYLLLFIIIFAETGLIVFPFLPGDSLLFVAGSIAASPDSKLNIQVLMVLLILASALGNKVNYLTGRAIGPRIFFSKKSWFFNKDYLLRAHRFYETHGGKAIIFARFIPMIRTFAPFVAGIGYMNLRQFSLYNLISAVLWVGTLSYLGYCFGTLPIIKNHFSLVIYGIVALSLMPIMLSFVIKMQHLASN